MRNPRSAACLRLTLALAVVLVAAVPASAQGFFDLLFGGGLRRSAPPPPPSRSFADPRFDDRADDDDRPRDTPGPGVAYCVRLCDGRHFPINYRGSSSAADICRAFCPAAATQIYSGGSIDRAVAPNGRRYSDLPNAFVYREKLVPDCTCDGKSPTGLVRQGVDDDPTLRPGDFVAGEEGLTVYRGEDRRGAPFTPVARAPGLSPALRKQLSDMRILPARTAEETGGETTGQTSRNVPQRDQAAR